MKLVIFEVESWERETFRDLGDGHEVVYVDKPLGSDNAGDYADADVISTFIYSDLGGRVLSQFNALKFIATRSTGFDHIDLDLCGERGIKVSNVPTYGDNTVAEHVFALLLAISHNMIEAVDRTRKGDFSQRGLQGFDLDGRTMGIVGTGNIGRHAIRIAKGFGMDVLAYDIAPDEAFAAEIGFDYVPLEELLRRSDVVSLHVPANPSTRHMISEEQFAAMKHGAVLINTARGPIVNVRALLRALSDGRVAAAGLDVLPEEPTIREEAELLRSFFTERPHHAPQRLQHQRGRAAHPRHDPRQYSRVHRRQPAEPGQPVVSHQERSLEYGCLTARLVIPAKAGIQRLCRSHGPPPPAFAGAGFAGVTDKVWIDLAIIFGQARRCRSPRGEVRVGDTDAHGQSHHRSRDDHRTRGDDAEDALRRPAA